MSCNCHPGGSLFDHLFVGGLALLKTRYFGPFLIFYNRAGIVRKIMAKRVHFFRQLYPISAMGREASVKASRFAYSDNSHGVNLHFT